MRYRPNTAMKQLVFLLSLTTTVSSTEKCDVTSALTEVTKTAYARLLAVRCSTGGKLSWVDKTIKNNTSNKSKKHALSKGAKRYHKIVSRTDINSCMGIFARWCRAFAHFWAFFFQKYLRMYYYQKVHFNLKKYLLAH